MKELKLDLTKDHTIADEFEFYELTGVGWEHALAFKKATDEEGNLLKDEKGKQIYTKDFVLKNFAAFLFIMLKRCGNKVSYDEVINMPTKDLNEIFVQAWNIAFADVVAEQSSDATKSED